MARQLLDEGAAVYVADLHPDGTRHSSCPAFAGSSKRTSTRAGFFVPSLSTLAGVTLSTLRAR